MAQKRHIENDHCYTSKKLKADLEDIEKELDLISQNFTNDFCDAILRYNQADDSQDEIYLNDTSNDPWPEPKRLVIDKRTKPKNIRSTLNHFNEIQIDKVVIVKENPQKTDKERYLDGYWDMYLLSTFLDIDFIVNSDLFSYLIVLVRDKVFASRNIRYIDRFVNHPKNTDYTISCKNKYITKYTDHRKNDLFPYSNETADLDVTYILSNIKRQWNPYILWRRLTQEQKKTHMNDLIPMFIDHKTVKLYSK